jgi:hypothetical protein
MLQASAIAPCRLTRPNVGRSPVAPQRVHGETIEPRVSVPRAKPTRPAATAADEPADEPEEPSSGFQGCASCAEPDVAHRQRAERQLGDQHRARLV